MKTSKLNFISISYIKKTNNHIPKTTRISNAVILHSILYWLVLLK